MDEIIGYNDDEIIGADDWDVLAGDVAVGARPNRGQLAARMRNARAVDPNAVVVEKRQNQSRRRKVLAAPAAVIPASSTVTQTFKTQELFRPERFVVQTTNAASVAIESIVVGTSNQFASTGSVPAEIFAPDAVDVDVHFMTANVGNDIVVTYLNLTAAPITFRAAFIGTAVN